MGNRHLWGPFQAGARGNQEANRCLLGSNRVALTLDFPLRLADFVWPAVRSGTSTLACSQGDPEWRPGWSRIRTSKVEAL